MYACKQHLLSALSYRKEIYSRVPVTLVGWLDGSTFLDAGDAQAPPKVEEYRNVEG